MERTDSDLLAEFIYHRKTSSLAKLVERHSRMVFRICNQMLQNTDDAEDAFQATFLVLLKKSKTLLERESLAGWLYHVAVRNCFKLREARAKRREKNILQDFTDEVNQPWLAIQDDHTFLTLNDELQKLPERYREVMILCYIEGLSRKELAQRLGCSVPSVKGTLERARHQLRQRMIRRGVAMTFALGVASSTNAVSFAAQSSNTLITQTVQACCHSGPSIQLTPNPFMKMLKHPKISNVLTTTSGKVVSALVLLLTIISISNYVLARQPQPTTIPLTSHPKAMNDVLLKSKPTVSQSYPNEGTPLQPAMEANHPRKTPLRTSTDSSFLASQESEFEFDFQPQLVWNRGGRQTVEILDGDARNLTWRNPENDLTTTTKLTKLRGIFFNAASPAFRGPHQIRLANGDCLLGNITALSETQIQIHSTQLGEISLNREWINRIENLSQIQVLLDGIADLENWHSFRTEDPWKQIQRSLELPDAVRITFRLFPYYLEGASFSFGIGAPQQPSACGNLPGLESWDDAIVFKRQDDFEPLYIETQKPMDLWIEYEQISGKVVVGGNEGELYRTRIPALPENVEPGIYLRRQTQKLQFEHLRIQELKHGVTPTSPGSISTQEGNLEGKLLTFDGAHWTIETSQGIETIERDELLNADFQFHPPVDKSTVTISYSDGTLLSGQLESFDNRQIKLKFAYAEESIEVSLEGVQAVLFF